MRILFYIIASLVILCVVAFEIVLIRNQTIIEKENKEKEEEKKK